MLKYAMIAIAVVAAMLAVYLMSDHGGSHAAASATTARLLNTTTTAPPPPPCKYSVEPQLVQCNAEGCHVSFSVYSLGDVVETYVDGVLKESYSLPSGVFLYPPLYVKYGGSVKLQGRCVNYTYVLAPPAITLLDVQPLSLDAARRVYRARVAVRVGYPVSDTVYINGHPFYMGGGRLDAEIETEGRVEFKMGNVTAAASVKPPAVLLSAYFYRTRSGYTYVVRYNVSGVELVATPWFDMHAPGSTAVFTTSERLDELCVLDTCVKPAEVKPELRLSVSWYYLYNFPLAVVKIENRGPGYWEGEVRVGSYLDRGGGLRTAWGVAYAEWPDRLLADLGASLYTGPVRISLDAGESAALAAVPPGDLAVSLDNKSYVYKLPPLPKRQLAYNCTVVNATGPADFTNFVPRVEAYAYLAAKAVCRAVLTVDPGEYTVVYPYVEVRLSNFTIPVVIKAVATQRASLPFTVEVPYAVYTDRPIAGYTCRAAPPCREGACPPPYFCTAEAVSLN